MSKNLVTDFDKLKTLIEPTITQEGFQLYDINILEEEGNLLLQVIIDSDNEISVEDCVKVANLINPILDENEDLFITSYILDVCSKGTEE